MNERTKITAGHLARQAIVYLRQSSAAQVEHNRESTERQYALANKARELGWPEDRIVVIDEDLGLSGSGAVARSGFARLTAEVALARVGLVLGLEVSRLARNNADWHRLIDLAGLADTLIGDADGIYHPALFNDRLLLGLKGTMSEAELHVLRARLNGGIRNKAARGELRRGLPVGLVWGDADGEVRLHPDEAVVSAIRNVFARFAEMGSARRVWLWFRSEGLKLPLQMNARAEIRWVEASYTAIHHVLTNPVYAGSYTYGKTRQETILDACGVRKTRIRRLPRSEWQVLIPEHHPGFIDWQTYEANQARIAKNTRGKSCRRARRNGKQAPPLPYNKAFSEESGSFQVFRGSSPITMSSLSSKAHQKSGSFPPPALPSFVGRTTLSDSRSVRRQMRRWSCELQPKRASPDYPSHPSSVPCHIPRRTERVRASIASPFTQPSP